MSVRKYTQTRRIDDTVRQRASETGEHPPLDLDKLKEAWDANVATQRELIRVVEATADENEAVAESNLTVKWMMLILLAVMGMASGHLHYTASKLEQRSVQAQRELEHMRVVLDGVMSGVAKHSTAQLLDDTTTDPEAVKRVREEANEQFRRVQKLASDGS